MICMENLGKFVKTFRLHPDRGWTTAQMAAAVTRHQALGKPEVKRQHIEQLEAAGDRVPRYVVALARAMGTTTDALLTGQADPAPIDLDQSTDINPAEAMRAALNILGTCLHGMEAESRTAAGYFLQQMANSPDGGWAARLADLLQSEIQPVTWAAIGSSIRAGNYSVGFQKQEPRMKPKSGSQPGGAVAASHLPTGPGDAATAAGRPTDQKGSGNPAAGSG